MAGEPALVHVRTVSRLVESKVSAVTLGGAGERHKLSVNWLLEHSESQLH